jgi:hypothetical protein
MFQRNESADEEVISVDELDEMIVRLVENRLIYS